MINNSIGFRIEFLLYLILKDEPCLFKSHNKASELILIYKGSIVLNIIVSITI
jgi:hypothetical protein